MNLSNTFHYSQSYQIHPRSMHGGSAGVGMEIGVGNLTSTLFGTNSSNSPEILLGPFPCLKVSNLPPDVSFEDLLILFQGYVVIDIFLCLGSEAFVLFANPMDFQMAMQRDRQTMGGRIIEVTPSQRTDYYSAIAEKMGTKGKDKSNAEASTVLGEEGIQDGGISDPSGVLSWALGQPTATQALNPGSSEAARGRGAGIQPGRVGGRGAAVRRTGGGIQVGEHTGFLRMRGLPFSSTKEEITKFFDGHKIVPETVVLTYRGDGRATGEGYIGFETPDDSKAAMALHRNTMGSRYIELFISNKEEHSRAFARFGGR
mmetsp:Transcript_40291/g.45849  ORF Transcript_40291/g.45849 Transcript_40291/m.45849 type:complete len:315 (-) Transcript_40291:307-1251(-)